MLFWQRIDHWNHTVDNNAEFLSGLSNSDFGENPSMNSGNYFYYDQVPSQSFDYFFDEITKEYCCCTCSYKSTVKRHIKMHLMTHSGDKPFKCQFCEYSCTQKGNLNIHIRTHTGERPFVCSICSSAFATKYKLKRHMKTHR